MLIDNEHDVVTCLPLTSRLLSLSSLSRVTNCHHDIGMSASIMYDGLQLIIRHSLSLTRKAKS